MLLNVLINPIRIIGSTLIGFTIRRLGFSNNYLNLFTVIYTSAVTLSRVVGVIPTLRVIWRFRGNLARPFTVLRTLLTSDTRLNQFVVQTMLTTIEPYWIVASTLTPKLKWFFLAWFTILPLGLLRPIMMFLTKSIIGVIFTTIGILWNETLSSFTYLKSFALIISDFLEHYFNFHIPTFNDNSIKESVTFSLIGWILIGFLGFFGLLCAFEAYSPDSFTNVPALGGFLEHVNDGFRSWYNWLTSTRMQGNQTIFNASDVSDTATNGSSSASSGYSTPTVVGGRGLVNDHGIVRIPINDRLRRLTNNDSVALMNDLYDNIDEGNPIAATRALRLAHFAEDTNTALDPSN